jgi:AsmA protein
VTNNDLSMKSPVLRVAGKGTVSLPPKTVNYRLEPTIVGSLKGQGDTKDARTGLTIPLVIAGPWANPSITPDVVGMLQDGLKNPEALKQNLKDITGQLKDFNSPKDIGKALLGAPPKATPADGAAAATPSTKSDAITQGIGGLLNAVGKN